MDTTEDLKEANVKFHLTESHLKPRPGRISKMQIKGKASIKNLIRAAAS